MEDIKVDELSEIQVIQCRTGETSHKHAHTLLFANNPLDTHRN